MHVMAMELETARAQAAASPLSPATVPVGSGDEQDVDSDEGAAAGDAMAMVLHTKELSDSEKWQEIFSRLPNVSLKPVRWCLQPATTPAPFQTLLPIFPSSHCIPPLPS